MVSTTKLIYFLLALTASMAKSRKRQKVSRKKTSKKDNPVVFLGALILFILLVVIASYLLSPSDDTSLGTEGVLVTVNGDAITAEMLDFQYNLLPAQYQLTLSREDVLSQLINEQLVVQAAAAEGIDITEADVHERIQEILTSGGMTIENLQENLDFFNVSMDMFENLIWKQLVIEAYRDARIIVPEPSEEDLQLIYAARIDQFSTPEQARVRHILVSNQREDAAVIAKDAYDRARDGEDFCDLVVESSDDRGSLETCGEYTFGRGVMVPEFEEASFEMALGEFKLIQSMFGYHVIEKLESLPATVKSFDDVRGLVVSEYENVERSRLYEVLLSDLRDVAVIIFPNDPVAPDVETPVEEPVEEPVVEEEPDEDVVIEVPVPEEPDVEEMVMEQVLETEDTVPEQKDTSSVIACVRDSAVLYGTSWSTDTRRQMDLIPGVDVVMCDENPEVCAEKGVQAYPSWIVDDQLLLGVLTLDELANAATC